ncbi:hypothetical protein FB446DRAFT_794493 [Lentinula raphanica]|nr:hypothetical protein FB446DRAFT_794493 [Lentinula raphanica]
MQCLANQLLVRGQSDIPSKTSSSRDSHEANKVTTIFTQYDTFVVDIWFNLEWEELGSDAEHYLSGTAYQKSASLLIIKSSRVAREPYRIEFINKYPKVWASAVKKSGFDFSVTLYNSKGEISVAYSGVVDPCPEGTCESPSGHLKMETSPAPKSMESTGYKGRVLIGGPEGLKECRKYMEAALRSPHIYFEKSPQELEEDRLLKVKTLNDMAIDMGGIDLNRERAGIPRKKNRIEGGRITKLSAEDGWKGRRGSRTTQAKSVSKKFTRSDRGI